MGGGDGYGVGGNFPTTNTTTTIATDGQPSMSYPVIFFAYGIPSDYLSIKSAQSPVVLAFHNDPSRSSIVTIHSTYIFPTFPTFQVCMRTLASCGAGPLQGESEKLLFTFHWDTCIKHIFFCYPFSIGTFCLGGSSSSSPCLLCVFPLSFLFLSFCGVLFFWSHVFPLLDWGVQCLHFASFIFTRARYGRGNSFWLYLVFFCFFMSIDSFFLPFFLFLFLTVIHAKVQ